MRAKINNDNLGCPTTLRAPGLLYVSAISSWIGILLICYTFQFSWIVVFTSSIKLIVILCFMDDIYKDLFVSKTDMSKNMLPIEEEQEFVRMIPGGFIEKIIIYPSSELYDRYRCPSCNALINQEGRCNLCRKTMSDALYQSYLKSIDDEENYV